MTAETPAPHDGDAALLRARGPAALRLGAPARRRALPGDGRPVPAAPARVHQRALHVPHAGRRLWPPGASRPSASTTTAPATRPATDDDPGRIDAALASIGHAVDLARAPGRRAPRPGRHAHGRPPGRLRRGDLRIRRRPRAVGPVRLGTRVPTRAVGPLPTPLRQDPARERRHRGGRLRPHAPTPAEALGALVAPASAPLRRACPRSSTDPTARRRGRSGSTRRASTACARRARRSSWTSSPSSARSPWRPSRTSRTGSTDVLPTRARRPARARNPGPDLGAQPRRDRPSRSASLRSGRTSCSGSRPPGRASPQGPSILFLNSGRDPHTGPNRMWVELSRAWAALGFPCYRFDLSGLGDSPVRAGQVRNLVRAPEAFDDMVDVVHDVDRCSAAGPAGAMSCRSCSSGSAPAPTRRSRAPSTCTRSRSSPSTRSCGSGRPRSSPARSILGASSASRSATFGASTGRCRRGRSCGWRRNAYLALGRLRSRQRSPLDWLEETAAQGTDILCVCGEVEAAAFFEGAPAGRTTLDEDHCRIRGDRGSRPRADAGPPSRRGVRSAHAAPEAPSFSTAPVAPTASPAAGEQAPLQPTS